ncbi:hypothetical protein [Cellulophaga sp. L1A9]|uniref:hypothetical protein n=1 Tax=Cellulophaga sp. L1A9 TaxID=2686362 RepID=UPI00131E66B9|nr:hypothetical protein [Cellulophaga sp. L1A9]
MIKTNSNISKKNLRTAKLLFLFISLIHLSINAQYPSGTDVSTLTNPFSCTGEAYIVYAPDASTSSTLAFISPSTPSVENSSFVFNNVTVNPLAYNVSVAYGYGFITGDQDTSFGPNRYDI